mmetsp:Transcript_34409/g.80406  ORF Transcript_34409/g.80406 Transcript_34409/m.80406 type:complete len:215 (-) Transcript_34409:642-1286(-)
MNSIVLIPVNGGLVLGGNDLFDPLDVADPEETGADEADGEAMVAGERLAVHLIRQKNVTRGVHGLVDRNTTTEWHIRLVLVKRLELDEVHVPTVGLETAMHQHVPKAGSTPHRVTHGRIKEGANDEFLLVDKVRPSHTVPCALERRHDLYFGEGRLQLVQSKHLVSLGRCDCEAVVLDVDDRHRHVVPDVVELRRSDIVLQKQLGRRFGVVWLG